MRNQNERVELEMRIMKYREMLRNITDCMTANRLSALIAELERKLREIDE
jgi:hypothetical protein